MSWEDRSVSLCPRKKSKLYLGVARNVCVTLLFLLHWIQLLANALAFCEFTFCLGISHISFRFPNQAPRFFILIHTLLQLLHFPIIQVVHWDAHVVFRALQPSVGQLPLCVVRFNIFALRPP